MRFEAQYLSTLRPQKDLGCCAEPQPVVQQERVADRAAAVPANTNVEDKQVMDGDPQ